MFVLQSYNLKPPPPPPPVPSKLGQPVTQVSATRWQAKGQDRDPKVVLPALGAEVPGSVLRSEAGVPDPWLQPIAHLSWHVSPHAR